MLNGTKHELNKTDSVMIILNSLLDAYTVVKNYSQYTSSVPSYDLLINALNTREREIKREELKDYVSLFVKGKSGNSSNK